MPVTRPTWAPNERNGAVVSSEARWRRRRPRRPAAGPCLPCQGCGGAALQLDPFEPRWSLAGVLLEGPSSPGGAVRTQCIRLAFPRNEIRLEQRSTGFSLRWEYKELKKIYIHGKKSHSFPLFSSRKCWPSPFRPFCTEKVCQEMACRADRPPAFLKPVSSFLRINANSRNA